MSDHGINPEEFERRVLREMRACQHFKGLIRSTCEIGVEYSKVASLPLSGFGRKVYPCIDEEARANCSQCKLQTRAEAEAIVIAREVESKKSFTAIRMAHEDAAQRGLGKGRGGSGDVACAKCGSGRIRYAVAALNGHMHGHCSTPGCLAWME